MRLGQQLVSIFQLETKVVTNALVRISDELASGDIEKWVHASRQAGMMAFEQKPDHLIEVQRSAFKGKWK